MPRTIETATDAQINALDAAWVNLPATIVKVDASNGASSDPYWNALETDDIRNMLSAMEALGWVVTPPPETD